MKRKRDRETGEGSVLGDTKRERKERNRENIEKEIQKKRKAVK